MTNDTAQVPHDRPGAVDDLRRSHALDADPQAKKLRIRIGQAHRSPFHRPEYWYTLDVGWTVFLLATVREARLADIIPYAYYHRSRIEREFFTRLPLATEVIQ